MAFESYPRRSPHVVALTLSWGGVPRTLRFGRATALAIFAILPILAVWYFGATAYFVFHDQLLASLIARQTDIQYSYEDRIAVLRTQLDRETSRSLVDRQTLATTIQDLASRSEQLAARAVTIDALVRGLTNAGRASSDGIHDNPLLSPAPTLPSDASAFDLPPSSPNSLGRTPASTLGFDGSEAPTPPADPRNEDHVDLSPEQQSARVAARLAHVEGQQSDEVARLRDPMVRSVARLRSALAETGLSLSRWNLPTIDRDVGGPFVPLPDDARTLSFDQNIALLQDAVVQQARLSGIVDKVPLRRPLDGDLQVTSPFGARLDPFFGRPAMHTGLDLMQPYGGPVMATASGTVTIAGSEGGYGNMVEIDHGNGLVTRYAHLSSIEVVAHQKVAAGMIVGRVGSTGRATGPHLHYETRINGEPVDPSRFLKAGAALFPG